MKNLSSERIAEDRYIPTSSLHHPLQSLTISLLFLLLSPAVFAQYFHSYGGNIPNASTNNCFDISVSGVGNLSATNGLMRVCLSIDQARPNDMDISLRAPDGTVVSLSTDNGGSSGNDYYAGVCFSDCGPSGNIAGANNFRGVYNPEGTLADFNTGVSGDGTWQLCINDDNASGGDGTLNYWSIEFGTNVMPATPSGETCADAYVLNTLPFSHTCMDLSGSVDNYSACTSMMEGADYVYSYTPSGAEEFLSIDIAQDFSAPSGFPTVILLDTCPDLAFAHNCIQTEIQFSSTENILYITSVPLTQGKTYYIVAASTSGTGGTYDMRIASGENGNDDCLNATVIDHEGEYAGNNYAATNPNLQAPNTTEMACNGSIDNFVYYTFTTDAIGSTVYVNLTDIDCDISCGGSCGIQLALFQAPAGGACGGPGTWGAPVHCEASTQTNQYYAWNGLLPNTQYYLMVDGNAGSQCVWNLRAAGDFDQTPLPVEFADISVESEAMVNNISWTTTAEINLHHFEVQHSRSLDAFETVSETLPAGDGHSLQSYTVDHSVNASGLHYYRVKNVDYDGQVGYSAIASVWVTAETVSLFPNPAKDHLNVRWTAEGRTTVRILNARGQEVLQREVLTNGDAHAETFDLQQLPAGVYLLSLEGAVRSVQRFVRK